MFEHDCFVFDDSNVKKKQESVVGTLFVAKFSLEKKSKR
jgi:hypothetical protein